MLEVIAGCMYSGKSEELIRRLRRSKIAGQPVLAFKPSMDNRYHPENIATHPNEEGTSSGSFYAIPIGSVQEIKKHIEETGFPVAEGVIGIDEVQFMENGVVGILESYANIGCRVVVAGLDLDSDGEPFGPMAELMAKSDSVTKLSAVCVAPVGKKLCGNPATRSFRYKSASTGDQIQVGSSGVYEARCRSCWVRGRRGRT